MNDVPNEHIRVESNHLPAPSATAASISSTERTRLGLGTIPFSWLTEFTNGTTSIWSRSLITKSSFIPVRNPNLRRVATGMVTCHFDVMDAIISASFQCSLLMLLTLSAPDEPINHKQCYPICKQSFALSISLFTPITSSTASTKTR